MEERKNLCAMLPVSYTHLDVYKRQKYSRTLRFSDINYAIASKEDKTAMFLGYSELLNALDSGSTTKLTICNKQVNRQAFEDTVLLPQRGDSLDGFVNEFNGMLESKISGSSASVEQERFLTVSVHKKNVDEARTFFSRVTGEITSKLSRLNSSSNELDAAERLDVLRGFFRPEEAALPFDLQSAMRRGHNLKDTICPDSLEFHRDYFKMGSQYGRVLFLKDYASYIKDSMILELTDLNRRMMLSIDMIPVPTDEAVREVENKLLGVETNVTNWQRRQNSNQNFSAVVPYDLEQQRKETREMLDDLTTRDQRMLFAVVTLVHLADSKEELDSDTETLQSIARKHLCQLAKLSFQQQDGLITALPLGLRRIDALRTLTTEALAVLMPFKAQAVSYTHLDVYKRQDRSGTPRYAHVRGTADPFRQDIAGSDKSYPFHYEGNGNQLFVFEAPIDLLSFICLYRCPKSLKVVSWYWSFCHSYSPYYILLFPCLLYTSRCV